MATLYANTNATGLGDGSSLANGYTTLAALFAAVSPDDTAIITSTRANPFGPNETLPDDCTLDVSGEAWISGASRIAPGGWTDDGGGVWSASLASEPHSCYWDYKQDDDDGTATLTDLNDARAAAAVDFYGFSRSRLRAWYGDLSQNTTTPTTPSEGEWGWSSGALYVHPPAGQSAATLAASLEYVPDTAVDGLVIGSGCTVRGGGDLTVIHTPVTTGNAGYSITSSRISGTSNNDVRGCNFVNWGWHAGVYPNFAHSGTLSVKDCVAHGIGATGQPFVAAFGDTNSDVTYTVDQNAYIPTPRIKPDGTVIDNSTDVAMYTSHDMAGSGVVTERRRRSLQLDFVQQQGVGTGVAVAGKYEDCWFVGEGAKASGNGTDVFTRCKLDRSGRGDTSSNATVLSTGNRTVRYIDSEVWTGDILESYLLSIGSGDVVELNNTIVHVGDAGTGGNTEVFRIATGTADSLEIGSSTFINEATVDGLVGAASAGIWNANFTGVSSDGANVFYGFAGSVTHSNGAVNPATRQWDWWVNNIAGASTDTAPGTEPTIDTTRPTVSSVALVEGNVVVTYSESISAVNDAATIAADIERATGTIASASINGAELTLTPDGSNPFTSETLLVPAAVVKNAAGNSNPAAILSTGLPDDYFIIRNADGTTLAVVDAATTEILISALGLGIGRHRVYVARVSGSCESDAVELTIELISVSNAATARIEPSNVTAELQADGTIQLQWMSLDSTRLLQVPAVFEVANVDDLATVLVTTGGGVGLRRATVPGYSDEELVQLAVRWSDGMIGGERGSWVYGPLLKADAAGPAPPTLYGGSSGGC